MKVRYSFSSTRTGHISNIRRQRVKYPQVAQNIVNSSDIILEVFDSRFIMETRNLELEKEIEKQNKKIIYVFNKSDLVDVSKLDSLKKELYPSVIVSCAERKGIKNLRDMIKRVSRTIKEREMREIKRDKIILGNDKRIKVGIIGYPNSGKSSLINLLVGKSAAGVGSEAGFTKNIQKIKLSEGIVLLDSPGVIPNYQYSVSDKLKISEHTLFGGKSYTQVKDPEFVVLQIMQKYPGLLEKHYSLDVNGNFDEFIEALGRRKGFLRKGGLVDENRTARDVLRAWQVGEIKPYN